MNVSDLTQIALDYHYNTEKYDRLIFTGSHKGRPMHRTEDEYRKSTINAIDERRIAIKRASELGFSHQEIIKEINSVMVSGLFNFEREHEYRNRNIPEVVIPKYL